MAYFPNGTAGEVLDMQCCECVLWEEMCPIALVYAVHNYDQCNIPNFEAAMNLLVNEKGICQLKPLLEKSGLKYRFLEIEGQQKLL